MAFDATAAYNSDDQDGAPQDNSTPDQSGGAISFSADQVAAMKQLAASGDLQKLGQYVAQYLQ